MNNQKQPWKGVLNIEWKKLMKKKYSLQLTDTLKGGYLWLADIFFFHRPNSGQSLLKKNFLKRGQVISGHSN